MTADKLNISRESFSMRGKANQDRKNLIMLTCIAAEFVCGCLYFNLQSFLPIYVDRQFNEGLTGMQVPLY